MSSWLYRHYCWEVWLSLWLWPVSLVSPWDSWAVLALALEPEGWNRLSPGSDISFGASPEFHWFFWGQKSSTYMPFLGGLWRWGGGGEREGKLVFSLYQWRWGDHTAGNGADHQEVTVLVMGTSSGVEPADRADVFWIWDFLNFAVNDSFRWEFWSEFRVAIVTVQMNEFLLFRYFSSWSFQS